MPDWVDLLLNFSSATGSVLYVALALGLELSGTRFLWALRLLSCAMSPPPPLLPDGFEACMRGRDAVCTGWVP